MSGIASLTRRRIDRIKPMRVGDIEITSSLAIIYAGVMIDSKLFRHHIFKRGDKLEVTTNLSRVMVNSESPQ